MPYQNNALVLAEEYLPYLLKEDTVCSLAIERIRVSIEEIGDKKPEDPSLRQAWNYYNTAKELYSLAIKSGGREEVITEPIVLWTYEKLWEGFNFPKGYRDTDMTIPGARFEPPRYEAVPVIMGRVLRWLKNSTLEPVRKSAIFHLLFEVVHPFMDGNGRLGRILLNTILIEGGLLNVAFRSRERYINALRKAEEGAVIVIEKLARGRKLSDSEITDTVLEYGDLEALERLIRSELLHSLRVYARNQDILLTPSQAAQLLGIKNKDYIRVLINRGALAGKKVGGSWLVPLAEVLNYAERRKRFNNGDEGI